MTGSPRSPHKRTSERILDSIRQWGPSTSRQLAERLGMNPDYVRNALWRMHVKRKAKHNGERPYRWETER